MSLRIDSSRCVAAFRLITLKPPVSSCGLVATENWSMASIEPAWRAADIGASVGKNVHSILAGSAGVPQ